MADARRDRWGRYLIEPADGGKERGYTRVTTVAKTLDDGGGLIPWKATAVMVGASRRPGLNARWQALISANPDPWYDTPESKQACKDLVEECATAGGSTDRADLGTALHSITQQLDEGATPIGLSAEIQADLDAYQATIAAAGVTYDRSMIEQLVILDEYEVAGTADRLRAHLPGVGDVVADLKTGTSLDFSWQAIAIQLACYARADWRYEQLEQGGRRTAMPELSQETGLVIHLPAGEARCDLYLVDLVAGWEAFERSMWTRGWRKQKSLHRKIVVDAVLVSGVDDRPAEPVPPSGSAGTDRRAALRARYQELNDDCKRKYLELGVDKDDLDAVERALDSVDAFATVQVPPVEPRPFTPVVEPERPLEQPTIDALVEAIKASDQRALINKWVGEGDAAGCPWNPRVTHRVVDFERARAALRLAEAASGDMECTRLIIQSAHGMLAHLPIGQMIGGLTVDDCAAVIAIAEAFGTTLGLRFGDDGRARLEGDVAAVLAAVRPPIAA